MYINNKPKCQECDGKAYYCSSGQTYPIRCESHKEDEDVNIIEKACDTCGLTYFIPNDRTKCNDCTDYTNPRVRHAKELRIKDVFDANGIVYASHDRIPEFACSKYRPDYVIDNLLFCIIIEVDENQHKSYAPECERGRMIQLHQDFGGKPLVFIRYNPDNYKDRNDKIIKGGNTNIKREAHLLKLIERIKGEESVCPLSVYYLFYDGYNSIPESIEIDYFNDWKPNEPDGIE
jgi:hypothetical protein